MGFVFGRMACPVFDSDLGDVVTPQGARVAVVLRLLRKETELRLTVLERFERELATEKTARLASVEINERVLTDTGYFTD